MQVLIANAPDAVYAALRDMLSFESFDVRDAYDNDASAAFLATTAQSTIVLVDVSDSLWGPAEAFLHQVSCNDHTMTYHSFVLLHYPDATPPKSFIRATKHLTVGSVTKPLAAQSLIAAVKASAAQLHVESTRKIRTLAH